MWTLPAGDWQTACKRSCVLPTLRVRVAALRGIPWTLLFAILIPGVRHEGTPEEFAERAKDERACGASCINGVFLDELDPERGRHEGPICDDCGILCELMALPPSGGDGMANNSGEGRTPAAERTA